MKHNHGSGSPLERLIIPDINTGSSSSASSNSHNKLNNLQNSQGQQKAIPGFVSKLFKMVTDPTNKDLIRWSPSGSTFNVASPEDFSKLLLPKHFKHNNFSSFVRQLNMYGFHKVPPAESSVFASSQVHTNSGWEFEHLAFQRGRPELLVDVKRRVGKDDLDQDTMVSASTLSHDLNTIKQQQQAIQRDINAIQRDSQLLWSETMASRERHKQQQQVIDKILHFLASVFSSSDKLPSGSSANSIPSIPNTRPGAKKQRLMIEDKMDPDLRRQVFELMNREPSPPTIDTRQRVFDLDSTSRDLTGDIEQFDVELNELIGYDEPILPDPPRRETADEFDITRYIQDPTFD